MLLAGVAKRRRGDVVKRRRGRRRGRGRERDGADVAPEEVQRLERVCILFDGNATASLDAARVQWKALTDAGCSAQYWSEASGRWEKKAEK